MRENKKIISMFVAVVFTASLFTGCGTILHPERKGQKGGSIDPKIAIFDGIGLLFFLIPGVIAFAVDFNNGTIYLPPESSDNRDMGQPANAVAVKAGNKLDNTVLETFIKEKYDLAVDLDSDSTIVEKIDSLENTHLFVSK